LEKIGFEVVGTKIVSEQKFFLVRKKNENSRKDWALESSL
jgi:hypothetical protein